MTSRHASSFRLAKPSDAITHFLPAPFVLGRNRVYVGAKAFVPHPHTAPHRTCARCFFGANPYSLTTPELSRPTALPLWGYLSVGTDYILSHHPTRQNVNWQKGQDICFVRWVLTHCHLVCELHPYASLHLGLGCRLSLSCAFLPYPRLSPWCKRTLSCAKR